MAAQRLSSEARKKQIVDIAVGLFAKKGFNGVTTREIAKKARVNEALLFRHFPNKEALYTEIIHQKMLIKPEMFDVEAAGACDDTAVFESLARGLLKHVEEDNSFIRLLFFSALEDHKLASLFFKERTQILFNFLEAYIQKRTGGGAFKDIEPKVAVRAFVGMFFHFILVTELFKVPKSWNISKETAVKDFVKIFLEGVRKK